MGEWEVFDCMRADVREKGLSEEEVYNGTEWRWMSLYLTLTQTLT